MASAPLPFAPAPIPGGTTPPQAVMPKPAKKVPPSTPNKVIGAKVTIQFLGEDGATYEASTTVSSDEYKVQAHALSVEEKYEKKRDPDTKDLIGFEDTGERILKFTMRYHVR